MNKGKRSPLARFLRRTALFLCPLLVLLGVTEWILWRNGDALPLDLAFRQQQQSSEETIYYRSYFSSQHGLFKLAAVKQRDAKILAIGSSRVMQLRGFLFEPFVADFYNAGGLLGSIEDLQSFAHMVLSTDIAKPEMLLVGIDPWWIKEGAAAHLTEGQDVATMPVAHVEAIRSLVAALVTGGVRVAFPPTETPLYNYSAIGSTARMSGVGFRKDGSSTLVPQALHDSVASPGYVDRETPPIIERVRRLEGQFAAPAHIDGDRVALLLSTLSVLREAGVEVHVILPPFSSEVYRALEESDELRDWWQFYKLELPALIREHGIDVFPVCTPADLGLSDTYMWDGFHPSEVCMATILREMVAGAASGTLLGQLDLTRLTERLEEAELPLVFDAPP